MSFPDPLLTKAEVAEMIRCTERTIERLVKKKMFPGPMRFGKEVSWFESAVHRWLDMQRIAQLDWQPRTPGRPRAAAPKGSVASSDMQEQKGGDAPCADPLKPGHQAHHPQRSNQAGSSVFTAEQIAQSIR